MINILAQRREIIPGVAIQEKLHQDDDERDGGLDQRNYVILFGEQQYLYP